MIDIIIVPYFWSIAEGSAIRNDWISSESAIRRALKYSNFANEPRRAPPLMVALGAVIYYRLNRYNDAFDLINSKFSSDGFLHSSLSSNETDYIRKFLSELLEYMAGSDSDNSARYLDLAERIAPAAGYSSDENVRLRIKQTFPLA